MQTPTSRPTNSGRWARCLGTGALAAATAVAVAAPAFAAPPSTVPIVATGSVAALSASSMEVQNPSSGQTTVTWTGTTSILEDRDRVGRIPHRRRLRHGDRHTSKSSKTTVAARSLTVTTSNSSGTCTGIGAPGSERRTARRRVASRGGGGGGFAFREAGNGGTRPSFPPGRARATSARPGVAGHRLGQGDRVKGSTVTVSGFTVSPGSFGRSSRSSSSSRSKKPNPPKTETLKVTTSGSTTVSATQTAAATRPGRR